MSAAYARFGWDLPRATDEARRQMLDADPALATQVRRRWQLDTLQAATCCGDLTPLVHESGLQTPLAAAIGAMGELERLLRDHSGTHLGHAFDDPDRMMKMLADVSATGTPDAIQLVQLIRGGASDDIGRRILDFTLVDRCLETLFARLRDQLRHVLAL